MEFVTIGSITFTLRSNGDPKTDPDVLMAIATAQKKAQEAIEVALKELTTAAIGMNSTFITTSLDFSKDSS